MWGKLHKSLSDQLQGTFRVPKRGQRSMLCHRLSRDRPMHAGFSRRGHSSHISRGEVTQSECVTRCMGQEQQCRGACRPLRSPPPPSKRQKAAPARRASYDTCKFMACETGHERVQLRLCGEQQTTQKALDTQPRPGFSFCLPPTRKTWFKMLQ